MSDKSTTTAATTSLASAERSRREMLGLAVVGGASAAFLATPARAEAAQVKGRTAGATTYRLTVMGTTDTHGNVFNWDYFKDAEYTDSKNNDIGLAKIATLVKAMRGRAGRRHLPAARRRRHHPGHAAVLLLRQDRPDHRRREAPDGHGHERDRLRRRRAGQPRVQLRPRDAARVRGAAATSRCSARTPSTGTPAPPPSRRTSSAASRCPGEAKPVKVGILGLVTPGVAIWDKANVEGRVKFGGIVEQGKRVGAASSSRPAATSSIVSCHSGATPGSSLR